MSRICAVTAFILMLGMSTAFAQEDEGGLYVGMGFGDFSAEINELDDIDDVVADLDEDESATKFFVGWRFSRFLAVQADYYDFGDATAILNALPVSSKSDGIAPSIVGTLPIGPVELFARAGIIYYEVEVALDSSNVIDASGSDPVYSAGLGLTLFERLNLSMEYELIDIDEFDDADAAWISGAWRF
jgi:OOP family OmpA-OmpF porin